MRCVLVNLVDTRWHFLLRQPSLLPLQNFVHARAPLFVYYSGVTVESAAPSAGPPVGGIELRVRARGATTPT